MRYRTANQTKLPNRPQLVYTSRVSLATRSPNAHCLAAAAARTPPALDPVRPGPAPRPAPPAADGRTALPARPTPAPVRATPAGVRAPPPRVPGNPVEPPQPTPPPCPTPARRLPPRPLGESWGEGLPFEASPCSAVAPSRPHRPPNPARKRPAAAEEFFRKNSYCARGPQSRPLQPLPSAAQHWLRASPSAPSLERNRVRGRSRPASPASRPPAAVSTEAPVLQPGTDTACGRSCPASSSSRPPMAAFVGCSGQNLESVIT